jgi:ATP-dependent exoDNAse (exonuclease V) beta subunit
VNYLDGLDWRSRANIDKLLSLLREMYVAQPRALAETADELDLLRLTDSEPDAPPTGKRDAVEVMTVHAAKGLEFPVVFVPAMHRGVDRRKPDLLASPEGIGARWRDGGGDTLYERVLQQTEERESEEANRLLYVALTRAEHRLILCYSSSARFSNWAKGTLRVGVAPQRVANVTPRPYEDLAAAEESPVLIERPQVHGQYPASASVTEVAAFRFTLSEEICEAEGLGGAAFGTAIHRLLAGLVVREPDSEGLRLVDEFRNSELGQRIARADRVEREVDLVFTIDDVVLHGQIDVWFEEGGQIVVADYKTDAVERPQSHGLQVRLYAIALERMIGRKVDSALVCYLRLGKTVTVGLSDADLEEARQAVRDWRDQYSGSGRSSA